MLSKLKKYYFEIILILFIPVLYWNNIPQWFSEWSNPDSFYAFGFFVFAFLFYLGKTNFDKIKNTPKENYYPGFLLILTGLVLYVVGNRSDLAQAVALSFPIFVSGIVLTLWGRKIFRLMIIPIILFALTLPIIPLYRITLPLQLLSAKMSSLCLKFLGLHSFAEGSAVFVEKYKLSVVAGCSGLKSTSTLFFFGIVYSHFLNTNIYKKILFVLSSIPLAVFVNVLRISTVGFYVLYNGYEGMQEFHDSLGIYAFILALGVMIVFARFIDNKELTDKNEV